MGYETQIYLVYNMLDVLIGANCLVGIGIKNFLLLGQDLDWKWLVFYISKSLDEFKGWISLPNAKRGLPLKRHFIGHQKAQSHLKLSPNPSQSNEHALENVKI